MKISFTETELAFLSRMRVARLATADAAGQPHVVPIVFAVDAERLYTPLDAKPKSVELSQLKRVRNILANPQVAVVVDHYDEDWTQLAWLMVKGHAQISEAGPVYDAGKRLIESRYAQYRQMPLFHRPIIVITPERVTAWGAV